MKPILEIKNVSKTFRISHQKQAYLSLRDSLAGMFRGERSSSETFYALNDVSFDVMPGDTLGIIGRNGAGKSTLLKILSRITPPSTGSIKVRGRIASLLEVGTGFHAELTGRENIYLNGSMLGMKRVEITSKFDEIVDFSGTVKFLDTQLKNYSSGMQLRLAFAVAAFLDPEILIIDEVLAVGDAEFQKRCIGKMEDVSKSGRTILFVSHNIGALQNLCKTGIVLKNGMIDASGDIRTCTDHYLKDIISSTSTSAGHILYESAKKDDRKFCRITSIELFNSKGDPMPLVCTWDDVRIRIHYESEREIENAGVDLLIKSLEGTNLLKLSTQPDGTLPLKIDAGKGCVECFIPKLPLAAGTYRVGAGLARPNIEWLNWNDDLCSLIIHPRDVYASGTAPSAERSVLATEHSWKKL